LPIQPSGAPPECELSVKVWNAMGGTIDWNALPILTEIYGVKDIEALIAQLIVMRDFEWPKQR